MLTTAPTLWWRLGLRHDAIDKEYIFQLVPTTRRRQHQGLRVRLPQKLKFRLTDMPSFNFVTMQGTVGSHGFRELRPNDAVALNARIRRCPVANRWTQNKTIEFVVILNQDLGAANLRSVLAVLWPYIGDTPSEEPPPPCRGAPGNPRSSQ